MAVKIPDPSDDLYLILDNVGLRTPDIINKQRPMPKIIQELRDELVQQLREYMELREQALIEEAHNGNL